MRLTIICLSAAAAAAAVPGKIQPATAQTAVSAYPWCLEHFGSGRRDCYYSTHEQCVYDARPLGGFCTRARIIVVLSRTEREDDPEADSTPRPRRSGCGVATLARSAW
jgi:Protein of unknown function (DUF3551)